MMEFRKVILLQLILLGVAALERSVADSHDQRPILDSDDECVCSCEPVTAEICKTEYKRTAFPNKVNGFTTQKNALQEFRLFPAEALTLQTCSSMLATFLCSYHFPPCIDHFNCEGVGPCDSLCEQVRGSCEPLLLQYNYTWPDHLNCSRFPTSESADPYCIPAKSSSDIELKPSCEKVKQPICSSLHPDYMTQFPNKDLITQDEANIKFNTFVPALNSNCSSMLKLLLCTSHYPICIDGTIPIYPCRHMCEEVQQSCEPFLLAHNMSWPEFLHCSNFPRKNETICADATFVAASTSNTTSPSTPTPVTTSLPTSRPTSTSRPTLRVSTIRPPTSDDATCEPLLPEVLEICGDIHPDYAMTRFPYGKFKCQRQAIEALKNSTELLPYFKLINQNCSAELKPFLCLHFFPMCLPSTGSIKIKNPCRSVCRKATNGCSACVDKWDFDCDDYKVKGTCLSLNDLKQYIRNFPAKETKC